MDIDSLTRKLQGVVREFCAPLTSDDPKRIENLLNCLDFDNQVKFLLAFLGTKILLEGSELSETSKVRPYVIDFINDCKELGLASDEIYQVLLTAHW